jgi:hypothetical protein
MEEFDKIMEESMTLLDKKEDIAYTPTTTTLQIGENVFKTNTPFADESGIIKVRHGNKILEYQVSKEEDIDIELIREEVKEQYNQKLGEIKEIVGEYFREFKYIYNKEIGKLKEKEQVLERRLQESNLMPNITHDHFIKGLSVAKGTDKGSLVWLYRTIYHPKMYWERTIKPDFSKKMITPITIVVTTKENKATSVRVMKATGWSRFEHYHSTGSYDCWGGWKFSQMPASTPDDIMNIVKHASALLEKINPLSFGNRSPKGLPRPATIEKHLTDDNVTTTYSEDIKLGREVQRSGVDERTLREHTTINNVWSADSVRRATTNRDPVVNEDTAI